MTTTDDYHEHAETAAYSGNGGKASCDAACPACRAARTFAGLIGVDLDKEDEA